MYFFAVHVYKHLSYHPNLRKIYGIAGFIVLKEITHFWVPIILKPIKHVHSIIALKAITLLRNIKGDKV